MHSHPRARPLFVDRSPPPPHPCRCQGPCCSATRRSASLPPYSPPSHGAPQAGTPLSLPATTVVRGTERRRRPLLSTPRSLARITHKARRLHPCSLVRAWSPENHLPRQISPKHRRRPPLFGELHPRSTPSSDSRHLTLLVTPPVLQGPIAFVADHRPQPFVEGRGCRSPPLPPHQCCVTSVSPATPLVHGFPCYRPRHVEAVSGPPPITPPHASWAW
jgi:hypothetical protein